MLYLREGDIRLDRERSVQIWLAALEARDGSVAVAEVGARARAKFDSKVVRFALAGEPAQGFALTVDHSSDIEPDVALLELLAVAPDSAGQGFGRALLDDAISASRASGYRRIELQVRKGNEAATRLYVRAGFEPTGGESPHPLGGQPMVEYSLSLSPFAT